MKSSKNFLRPAHFTQRWAPLGVRRASACLPTVNVTPAARTRITKDATRPSWAGSTVPRTNREPTMTKKNTLKNAPNTRRPTRVNRPTESASALTTADKLKPPNRDAMPARISESHPMNTTPSKPSTSPSAISTRPNLLLPVKSNHSLVLPYAFKSLLAAMVNFSSKERVS
ncbi:Uncharacterised protein [uncultured archaeon]|nr:Uncharacterised protein [uncultured archaeon]